MPCEYYVDFFMKKNSLNYWALKNRDCVESYFREIQGIIVSENNFLKNWTQSRGQALEEHRNKWNLLLISSFSSVDITSKQTDLNLLPQTLFK